MVETQLSSVSKMLKTASGPLIKRMGKKVVFWHATVAPNMLLITPPNYLTAEMASNAGDVVGAKVGLLSLATLNSMTEAVQTATQLSRSADVMQELLAIAMPANGAATAAHGETCFADGAHSSFTVGLLQG